MFTLSVGRGHATATAVSGSTLRGDESPVETERECVGQSKGRQRAIVDVFGVENGQLCRGSLDVEGGSDHPPDAGAGDWQ